MSMNRLEVMFEDYAEHHQTRGNKWCHRFGIPMIVFSLLGLLAKVAPLSDFGHLNLATVLILVAGAYYLLLDWRFALAMIAVTSIFYLGALAVPVTVHASLFVLGWILQFVGHGVYEKRRPAFFQNLLHLLVGPLWILNDVVHFVPAAGSDQQPVS
ncbi:MAG TPA: Mpo1-like protein [Thermoanaerobaculia bacterium]|nr:Mpo1-like protein [Thermoanaerobaculia bacterium]